jgi:phage shock protein C
MLGGIARGLATRFGLPVAAVRLAFIVGTIFAFWGAVVYVALWVIMPQEPLALPPMASPTTASPQGGISPGP